MRKVQLGIFKKIRMWKYPLQLSVVLCLLGVLFQNQTIEEMMNPQLVSMYNRMLETLYLQSGKDPLFYETLGKNIHTPSVYNSLEPKIAALNENFVSVLKANGIPAVFNPGNSNLSQGPLSYSTVTISVGSSIETRSEVAKVINFVVNSKGLNLLFSPAESLANFRTMGYFELSPNILFMSVNKFLQIDLNNAKSIPSTFFHEVQHKIETWKEIMGLYSKYSIDLFAKGDSKIGIFGSYDKYMSAQELLTHSSDLLRLSSQGDILGLNLSVKTTFLIAAAINDNVLIGAKAAILNGTIYVGVMNSRGKEVLVAGYDVTNGTNSVRVQITTPEISIKDWQARGSNPQEVIAAVNRRVNDLTISVASAISRVQRIDPESANTLLAQKPSLTKAVEGNNLIGLLTETAEANAAEYLADKAINPDYSGKPESTANIDKVQSGNPSNRSEVAKWDPYSYEFKGDPRATQRVPANSEGTPRELGPGEYFANNYPGNISTAVSSSPKNINLWAGDLAKGGALCLLTGSFLASGLGNFGARMAAATSDAQRTGALNDALYNASLGTAGFIATGALITVGSVAVVALAGSTIGGGLVVGMVVVTTLKGLTDPNFWSGLKNLQNGESLNGIAKGVGILFDASYNALDAATKIHWNKVIGKNFLDSIKNNLADDNETDWSNLANSDGKTLADLVNRSLDSTIWKNNSNNRGSRKVGDQENRKAGDFAANPKNTKTDSSNSNPSNWNAPAWPNPDSPNSFQLSGENNANSGPTIVIPSATTPDGAVPQIGTPEISGMGGNGPSIVVAGGWTYTPPSDHPNSNPPMAQNLQVSYWAPLKTVQSDSSGNPTMVEWPDGTRYTAKQNFGFDTSIGEASNNGGFVKNQEGVIFRATVTLAPPKDKIYRNMVFEENGTVSLEKGATEGHEVTVIESGDDSIQSDAKLYIKKPTDISDAMAKPAPIMDSKSGTGAVPINMSLPIHGLFLDQAYPSSREVIRTANSVGR